MNFNPEPNANDMNNVDIDTGEVEAETAPADTPQPRPRRPQTFRKRYTPLEKAEAVAMALEHGMHYTTNML